MRGASRPPLCKTVQMRTWRVSPRSATDGGEGIRLGVVPTRSNPRDPHGSSLVQSMLRACKWGSKLKKGRTRDFSARGRPFLRHSWLISATAPLVNTYVAGPIRPGDVCDDIPWRYGF